MRDFHRWRCAVWVCILLSCGFMLVPARAYATTGPTDFLPASKYKIAGPVRVLYTGQYVFVSAASGSRLTGGAMGVEVSDRGSLYGLAQFYGYDKRGSKTVWTATLYNFRQVNKRMALDILGPTGTPVLGHLSVMRSAKGDLSGEIELPAGTFSISWHKISNK